MELITFPSNTTEIIDQIRNAIGRPIDFIIVGSGIPCSYSGCGVNPLTNLGLNPFCPNCSGVGYVYEEEIRVISGFISWGHKDLPNWVTGGEYFTGDCLIQIKFTDEIEQLLEKTRYVVVDDVKMKIEKKIPRGVPKINRILLDLKQED
jgi:hypothetical protein